MKCVECKKAEAVTKLYDPVGVYDVCQPCFNKLDYEEWSQGVDRAFGSQKETRAAFKGGLIKLAIFAAIVAVIIIFVNLE